MVNEAVRAFLAKASGLLGSNGRNVNGRVARKVMASALVASGAIASALAADTYDAEIVGAPDGLRDDLARVSTLAEGERDFATTAAIRRIADRDVKAMEKALQAAGYYAGKATAAIEPTENPEKPKVIFTIDGGARFSIAEYVIVYEDAGEGRPATLAEAEVEANGRADGASLQEVQAKFLDALWNKGYPAAKMVARRAEANLEEHEARAVFTFESGPHATFGDIQITGAKETRHDFIEKHKTWKASDEFKRSKLVEYRDKLAATGLFGSVEADAGTPGADGAAPVLLSVQERKRRTIGAGLSYSTSEGPGGRLFFEYRNAFHRGERARIDAQASEVEQSLKLDFLKPLPGFPGSAFASAEFKNETTDAFNARTGAIAGGLSRLWLNEHLETRGGLGLETSKVTNIMGEERNYFVSLPLSATWSTEEDILNPTKGVRATFSITPYAGSDSFTISDLTARTRVNFGADDRFTAAFRGRLGSTFGSSLAALPANKRFYAGGGASVRGYRFQFAGPLDINNNPIGGRSIIEGAAELRARVFGNFQLAGFVDAGSVSATSLPDFGADMFVGVGAGVRYLTAVGPIRLDVAVPLEKRDPDRSFQLYISLGQPF
jgi:translocation and assembly module TamA